VLVAHTPPLQALAPQFTPQLPQLAGSVCTLTQKPPHSCSWPPHSHVPLTQVCPDAHAWLQLPQCATLVVKSTQSEPHWSSSAAHDVWHWPAEHTLPTAHAVPHVPQFAALESVSTQVPEHWVKPAWHWQLPFTQLVATEHVVPQLPQLASSLARSAHPVVHCTCPAAQTGIPVPPVAESPPIEVDPPAPPVESLSGGDVLDAEHAAITPSASRESRRR
jgi:hypothetical protein